MSFQKTEMLVPNVPKMPIASPGQTIAQFKAQQERINEKNEIKEWQSRGNVATGPDQFGEVTTLKQEQIIHARLWKNLDKWGILGDIGKFLTQPTPDFWSFGTSNESFAGMSGQGHWCVAPMFFGTTPWGNFSDHGHHDTSAKGGNSFSNSWWLAYAVTDKLEVWATPGFDLKWNGGASLSSPQATDTPFGIKYRTSTAYSPSLTLTLGGQAPTGRWDRLSNPNDASGAGTWYFNFGVTMLYTIPVLGHALVGTVWATANQATGQARLHGMSAYGTESGFDGWARPSEFGTAGQDFQYGITKKFGLVLDLVGKWSAPTSVKGWDATGNWTEKKQAWSDQFTVIPGFEYGFTPNLGFVAQVSVPVVGRNSAANLMPEGAFVVYY
ncbi:hypothetical protein FAI41_03000 [Acetobacteraceae bacterium]|nr:hypothetical protein FAI41_03000 [Acetobacteraceae bacterium]